MPELKTFVKNTIKDTLDQDYPHLLRPQAATARIVRCVQVPAGYYTYTLKMQTQDGNDNAEYPYIPGVACETMYQVGDRVVILLLYGVLQPYIIGKVVA